METQLIAPSVLDLRVALLSRGYSVERAAHAIGCNVRALWAALRGDRPASQALLAKLHGLLGDEAWNYATRRSDRLPHCARKQAA